MKIYNLIFSLTFLFISINTFCQESKWSKWQKSDCYEGIEFRTKKGGPFNVLGFKKTSWDIEFKNNYDKPIMMFSFDGYSDQNPWRLDPEMRLKHKAFVFKSGEVITKTVRIKSYGEIVVYVEGILFYDSQEGRYPCDRRK
jgi:hypothetical protein